MTTMRRDLGAIPCPSLHYVPGMHHNPDNLGSKKKFASAILLWAAWAAGLVGFRPSSDIYGPAAHILICTLWYYGDDAKTSTGISLSLQPNFNSVVL